MNEYQHSSVQIYLQLVFESLIAEVVEGQRRNERISGVQFSPTMFQLLNESLIGEVVQGQGGDERFSLTASSTQFCTNMFAAGV
jgi:hypothetical protein